MNRIRITDLSTTAATNPNTGKRRRGLSASTAKKYTVACNRLAEHFSPERDVTTISAGELWDWSEALNDKYTNTKTTNSYRSTIRAIWRELRKRGIQVCEVTDVFEMKPEERGVKAISEVNYWKELVSSGLRDAAMAALVTESGIRRGGLAGMKLSTTEIWSHAETGELCLATRVVEKGEKPRLAFGLDLSANLMRAWLDVRKHYMVALKVPEHDFVWIASDTAKPLSYHSFQEVFDQLKERARIPRAEPTNCHSMRHRFAINRLMAGMPLSIVSKLLGHSDMTTTDRVYTTMTDEEIKRSFFAEAYRPD